MRYSFIEPQPKPLVSLFSKIWILFISFVSLLLIFFGLFLLYKINSYKVNTIKTENDRVLLEKEVNKREDLIEYLLRQKSLGEEIYTRNTLLKNSMKNLFDLVPDKITLSRVIIKKNSLVIYGKTPTKDTFNFLLAAPLKSIFNKSNTIFYLSANGWYNFVSTNKITPTDAFNE